MIWQYDCILCYIVDIQNVVLGFLCTCFFEEVEGCSFEAVRKFRPFEGFFGFLDL